MQMSINNKPSSYVTTFLDLFGIKKINKHTRSIDLMKNSKQLILNNRRYEEYSNYYNQLTTTFSFKQPDINDYPVQKNQCIISLQKSHKHNHKRTSCISHFTQSPYPVIRTKVNHAKTRRGTDLNEDNVKQRPNSINESSLLRLIDQFNNMNSVIYKYISYKEKYSLISEKTNYSLLSELLCKTNYTHEVFNSIGKKENSFNVNDDNINITLRCDSIKLLFYIKQSNSNNSYCKSEAKNKTNTKKQEIVFPFELIPMFYGLSFEELKLFLALIIFYDSDSKTFEIDNTVFNEYYVVFKETKEFFKENSLFSKLNSKESVIQLEYPWITYTDRYIVKLKLPHYSFCINYLDKTGYNQLPINIEKTIGIHHLSNFIKTDFKDWDLYLMNSFCIYKDFRNVVNRALSKNPLKQPKQKIILGLPLKKSIEDLSDMTWDFFYSHKEGTSYYIHFNSLKILLRFNENDNAVEEFKTFDLSMKQTRQLLRLRQLFSIEELLKRCVIVDNKSDLIGNINSNSGMNVSFCYNTLDLFDDSYCRYLMEQEEHLNIEMNNNSKKEKLYDILFMYVCMFLMLFFREPSLEWKYAVSGDFNKKTYLFPKEISETIMCIPIKEWDIYFQKGIPQIYDETIICKGINL